MASNSSTKTSMKQLLVLVLIALALADSVHHIKTCSKREVELRVWKRSCLSAIGKFRLAKAEYWKYRGLYREASRRYNLACAALHAAEKREHVAYSRYKAAERIYHLARHAEDKLCNRLIRNVKRNTPCARLLFRARKNNRLVRCKLARRALKKAARALDVARLAWKKTVEISKQRRIAKIAAGKARDDANKIKLEKKAIYKTKLNSKRRICGHYRTLKYRFFGSKKRKISFGKKPAPISRPQ